ncbi:hypothetical protein [Halomarina ordinaria]|uniref:DUF4239 domain-containing protein n=1 Tax=Halomarina ordinaria TaxID=3033939 RepID=A0ABD5U3C6_9EURY|nr:hypothetical protein [Halomarina sp. PSRA2]
MSDDGENGDVPSDTMRGRLQANPFKIWVLMDARREVVAALVVTAVFVALTVFSVLGLSPLRVIVTQHNATWWLFSPMVGAIITGVTLVVTISQLVLSQELGALGDQRERMQGAIDFREDVRSHLGTEVSPPDPAQFLQAILDGIQSRGNELSEVVDETSTADDESLRTHTGQYVESLSDHAQTVGGRLEDSQFGTFDVLFAALDFNYSWKIHEARRLRQAHGGRLSEEADETLDDLIDLLEFFGPAREHFKTLYFQWELVNLMRVLLAASIPAITVAFGMLLYVDANTFTGVTLGVDNLAWVVNAACAVTLVPFALFLSYIFRIGTVAKRTLAIGPFILRETERSENIDWE